MSTQKELEAERFVHRGMQYLRATFAEETAEMTDDVLKNKFIDYCQFAVSHGFESEAEVMTLVDLLFRMPQDALDNPNYDWVKDILLSEDMDNEMKIDALYNAFALTTAMETEEADNDR